MRGRCSEAAAVAAWKKAEEEAASHRQGIETMYARITEVQKDLRTALQRDDALERPSSPWGCA